MEVLLVWEARRATFERIDGRQRPEQGPCREGRWRVHIGRREHGVRVVTGLDFFLAGDVWDSGAESLLLHEGDDWALQGGAQQGRQRVQDFKAPPSGALVPGAQEVLGDQDEGVVLDGDLQCRARQGLQQQVVSAFNRQLQDAPRGQDEPGGGGGRGRVRRTRGVSRDWHCSGRGSSELLQAASLGRAGSPGLQWGPGCRLGLGAALPDAHHVDGGAALGLQAWVTGARGEGGWAPCAP